MIVLSQTLGEPASPNFPTSILMASHRADISDQLPIGV